MGNIVKYLKRGFQYILKEYKQPIIKVEVINKNSTEMFKDKVFIVTGGGSGLGFYIAKKLIDESATVCITGRNLEKLKDAKEKLGSKCFYYQLDVCDIDKFDNFFDIIYNEHKKVDGIINNAGISLHEWDFMKVDVKKFDSQFQTNLKGSYFFTQSYIKKYLDNNQESGKVLFISSERGTNCDDLPYGLTKASINSLVEALSYRYYKQGLNINALSPGVTASDMTGIDKNGDLFFNNTSGRFFVPEEVSEVASFLLSDYSKCVSGEVVHTNGGNHIKRGY